MAKKSFRPRFRFLPAILVFSLLSIAPAFAQDETDEAAAWLYIRYKELLKKPCGQREEAIKIGKKLIAEHADDENNKQVIAYLKGQVPIIEKMEEACKGEESLENLFEKYKVARREPCGKRDEALRLGKRILQLYANDELNGEVINYVKTDSNRIEKEDEECEQSNPSSLPEPQKRIWFMAVGKKIIASEGDTPLALDVLLTMTATGYNIAVIDKNDSFNDDTITYAKLAIQRIEAGQTSQTGNWGATAPTFKTKENALAWMNLFIADILANRQNKKDEALPFFYKVTKFESDLRKDAQLYRTIGKYYFERLFDGSQSKFETENRNGLAERGLIAYAKAYKWAVESKQLKAVIEDLYAETAHLYRFRFKLGANEPAAGLNKFIAKLAALPLPEFDAPLEPVFEEPVELTIQRRRPR